MEAAAAYNTCGRPFLSNNINGRSKWAGTVLCCPPTFNLRSDTKG